MTEQQYQEAPSDFPFEGCNDRIAGHPNETDKERYLRLENERLRRDNYALRCQVFELAERIRNLKAAL